MNKKELPVEMEHIQQYLSQQPGIVVAYLFGSLARKQGGPHSDVDIAVLLDPTLSRVELVERQLQLTLALDDMHHRPVQVTLLNNAQPLLAFQVVRDGQLLYQRDEMERIDFEVRIMKVYSDLKPMLDFHGQALLKRIQEVGLGRRETDSSRTLEAARRVRERLKTASGR